MASSDGPRVWFITGTSTGLGRALTELILKKGEIVVATARQPSALDELVAQHSADRLLVLALDVTQPAQVTDAFARSKATFGRIDVVVNNAGYGVLGEVESVDEADARAMFETNFWGALRVTKAAVAFFRDDNPSGVGGRLLQISSMYGVIGGPCMSAYCASKHALEGMTKSLAQDLDPRWNIKITLVVPGWIRSSIIQSGGSFYPQHPAYRGVDDIAANRFRAGGLNRVSWKDTRRSVEVFYQVASLEDPPLHFLVGHDVIEGVTQWTRELQGMVEQYKSWSEGLEEQP